MFAELICLFRHKTNVEMYEIKQMSKKWEKERKKTEMLKRRAKRKNDNEEKRDKDKMKIMLDRYNLWDVSTVVFAGVILNPRNISPHSNL